MYTAYYQSPLGLVEINGTEKAITSLHFVEEKHKPDFNLPIPVRSCLQQLEEYFSGARYNFDLPIKLTGTGFQRQVWNALRAIPSGITVSYGDIAKQIGNPAAVRAVGGANNKNPISIIVPCHRVIGHDGSLTGYASGLWRKKWLLRHESHAH